MYLSNRLFFSNWQTDNINKNQSVWTKIRACLKLTHFQFTESCKRISCWTRCLKLKVSFTFSLPGCCSYHKVVPIQWQQSSLCKMRILPFLLLVEMILLQEQHETGTNSLNCFLRPWCKGRGRLATEHCGRLLCYGFTVLAKEKERYFSDNIASSSFLVIIRLNYLFTKHTGEPWRGPFEFVLSNLSWIDL